MAAHDVKFFIPKRPLGKSDVEFIVEKNGDTIGTLKISHGAAVWVPKHGRLQRKLSWTRLAELFEEHGTKI